jgi:signal transduction histidine kinase
MSTHKSDSHQALANAHQVQQMATVIHNIGNALTGMNSALRHASQNQADLERICAWLQGIDPESLDAQQLQQLVSKLTSSLNNIILSAANPHNLTLNNERLMTGAKHIKATINSYQNGQHKQQGQEHFQLHDAINSAMALLVLNQVTVSLQCSNTLSVYGPRNLFEQMLLNLLKNSIEAMQQRQLLDAKFQPMLVIKAKTSAAKMITLSIIDNGCGITELALDKLFESGYTSKKTGSGLGLGSVADTLALFQGDINITSQGHNQGSRVRLSLPILS